MKEVHGVDISQSGPPPKQVHDVQLWGMSRDRADDRRRRFRLLPAVPPPASSWAAIEDLRLPEPRR
jgi:hypothetical protein